METKTCGTCKEEKILSEFNKRGNGLQSVCRKCNSDKLKEHYYKNRQYYKDKSDRRYDEIKEFINSIKSENGCTKCSENHPACLDFHHTGDKQINISSIPSYGWAMDRVRKEIDKCIILCSNCHRKLHYEQNASIV